MNNDDLRDQQIERYIHNRMNAEERLQFEKQLQMDSKLKKEVGELQEMKSAFDDGLIDFKKKIIEAEIKLEKENFFNKTKLIPIKRTGVLWWAIAASVILMAGLIYFFNSKSDVRQLAIDSAKNDFSLVRGEMDEADSLFETGSYKLLIKRASSQLNTSIISKEEKIKLYVYISRSYILLNTPEDASKLIESLSDELKQDCDMQFALALSYLSEIEKEKAKKVLNLIVENKCYPQDINADKLLKKI